MAKIKMDPTYPLAPMFEGMARPSKQLPPELIAEWEAGALSSQALAAKYGIGRRTIETKLAAIPRDPTGARRAGVRAGVSGLQDIESQARKASDILQEEVGRDVAALSLAAKNALGILRQVEILLTAGDLAPRGLLNLASANSAALESWRRARELDEPPGPNDMVRKIELVEAVAREAA